jgi:hypothetical protein
VVLYCIQCEYLISRSDADEKLVLQGCDAASLGGLVSDVSR